MEHKEEKTCTCGNDELYPNVNHNHSPVCELRGTFTNPSEPKDWKERFDENFDYDSFDSKRTCEQVKSFIDSAIRTAQEQVLRDISKLLHEGIDHYWSDERLKEYAQSKGIDLTKENNE